MSERDGLIRRFRNGWRSCVTTTTQRFGSPCAMPRSNSMMASRSPSSSPSNGSSSHHNLRLAAHRARAMATRRRSTSFRESTRLSNSVSVQSGRQQQFAGQHGLGLEEVAGWRRPWRTRGSAPERGSPRTANRCGTRPMRCSAQFERFEAEVLRAAVQSGDRSSGISNPDRRPTIAVRAMSSPSGNEDGGDRACPRTAQVRVFDGGAARFCGSR